MELNFEYVWPPSEKSEPVMIAYCFGLATILWYVIGRQKDSKKKQQSHLEQSERLRRGLALFIADVEQKDQEHKDGSKRTDFPDDMAQRAFSYLWEEAHDKPTSEWGLNPSDELVVKCKQLLDRSICAKLEKIKTYTVKALEMQKNLKLGIEQQLEQRKKEEKKGQPTLIREKSDAELEDIEWMEKHGTSQKELSEYLSGEKLDSALKLVETVIEKLTPAILQPNTTALFEDCKSLRKKMRRLGGKAFRMIFSIFAEIAHFWIFSVLVGFVGPMGWAEFDRYLLSGLVVGGAMKDGVWDRAISVRLARNLVMIVAVWMLSDMTSNQIMAVARRRFTMKLKLRFMETLMYQDFEYFEKHGLGKIQSRLNTDVEKVSESLLQLPRDFLVHNFRLCAQMVVCFRLAPADVVALAFLPLPVIAYSQTWLMRKMRREREVGRKVSEQAAQGTSDVISNIKTVRGFATEELEISKYKESSDYIAILEEKMQIMGGMCGRLGAFLFLANVAYVAFCCAEKVSKGEMKQEDVGVVCVLIGLHIQNGITHNLDHIFPQIAQMLTPLYRILDHFSAESHIEPNPNIPGLGPIKVIVGSKTELSTVIEKLETQGGSKVDAFNSYVIAKVPITSQDEQVHSGYCLTSYCVEDDTTPVLSIEDLKSVNSFPVTLRFVREKVAHNLKGEIIFDNVCFRYPTDLRKKVLDGLSFTIEPGMKVGICGEAGCGKSTTMLLLQRLFDVEGSGGPVKIDGIDMRLYNVHFLRRRIGLVAQQTVLFKTTVRENICYGMLKRPSEDEIVEALKSAQAWDFIDAKPDKLLTVLTETGGGFSGGQMQRLSIARSLIRKPDIMLLDEATSALDPVNERAVQDTLDRVMKGFTTLAIAHRLTTIKDADRILVLDKGRLVEMGTHQELLAIPITSETLDGKKKITAGFYHNQWKTQFNEQGLSTRQLQDKIQLLQAEIKAHESKIQKTHQLMGKWRTAGKLASVAAVFSSPSSANISSNPQESMNPGNEELLLTTDPAEEEMERVISLVREVSNI